MDLPLELWAHICELSSYLTNIRLSSTCKKFLPIRTQIHIPPVYMYHGKEINKNTFKDTVYEFDKCMRDNEKVIFYSNSSLNIGEINQQDAHVLVTVSGNKYICRIKMFTGNKEHCFATNKPISIIVSYYKKISLHLKDILIFIRGKYPNINSFINEL